MIEFWQAVSDPNFGFLRLALVMALVAAVPFGITGTFVVARRITYVAGAIAHAVLGGIGGALYLQRVHGWTTLDPLAGALVAALLAAWIISWVSHRGNEREDSVIGAIWAIGMATGLLFLARTPGYTDPLSYLFGNILVLSARDVWWVGGFACALLAVAVGCFSRLQAVCFDAEFARLRGVSHPLYYTLLLSLVAIAVVLLISVVGAVLVVALLTLPAAMASRFARTLPGVMALASLLAMSFSLVGLAVSYRFDLPSGASIVLVAAIAYLASQLKRAG
jgi:zinc transport system permease protein